MKKADFESLLEKIQSEEREVRSAGQAEYAHGDDAFGNFKRLSTELGMPMELVLWVYFRKHLDGILAHINGNRSQREDVRGRIKDARMYLALLWGMVEERMRDPGSSEAREPITPAERISVYNNRTGRECTTVPPTEESAVGTDSWRVQLVVAYAIGKGYYHFDRCREVVAVFEGTPDMYPLAGLQQIPQCVGSTSQGTPYGARECAVWAASGVLALGQDINPTFPLSVLIVPF